jgi:organic radical activating enzyme
MDPKTVGRIGEIFLSIQGEGLYLGRKQAFVRFFGCNMACKFCDTKQSRFSQYTARQIAQKIGQYSSFDSVSITGGEPLLQAAFLQELLKLLKQQQQKIYLETNGTLVEELRSIIDCVDIVAMDFKLPSSTGEKDFFSEHNEFLKIARAKEVFVKAVITANTTIDDIGKAVSTINNIDRSIVLVLQPDNNQLSHSLFQAMLKYRSFALEHIDNVRIIPQMHRIVGVK